MLRQNQDEPCFLIYCTIDHTVAGNPFWHSFVVLAAYDQASKKFKVDCNYGYYGLPSGVQNPTLLALLQKLALDFDPDANHGMLKPEEFRFIDHGKGLHHIAFQLTPDDYQTLLQRYARIIKGQDDAINEAAIALDLPEPGNARFRHHRYEQHGRLINQHEMELAADEHREPRLTQFSINPFRFNNCKTHIIGTFADKLKDEQITALKGWFAAVPRSGGPHKPFFLHSQGTLLSHKKSGGKMAHYRDGRPPHDASLYLTLPPTEFVAYDKKLASILTLSTSTRTQVESVISQLQQLYWLMMDAVVPDNYQSNKLALAKKIEALYEQFAIIDLNPHSHYSLFSTSREQQLIDKHNAASSYIDKLYQVHTQELAPAGNEPELAIAMMSTDDKEQFCKILGREYLPEGELAVGYCVF